MTYSTLKSRNLIKTLMAVYTDGYILNVFGSYTENVNDAAIMEDLLNAKIWSTFEAGDIFIIDRGFRDVENDIERHLKE